MADETRELALRLGYAVTRISVLNPEPWPMKLPQNDSNDLLLLQFQCSNPSRNRCNRFAVTFFISLTSLSVLNPEP